LVDFDYLSENHNHHPQKKNKKKKRASQPGEAFSEDTAFKLGFEIVTFKKRLCRLSSSLLCEIDATQGFLTLNSIR
jgi:hypothetical protein